MKKTFLTYKYIFFVISFTLIISAIIYFYVSITDIIRINKQLIAFENGELENVIHQNMLLSTNIKQIDKYLLNKKSSIGIQQQVIKDIDAYKLALNMDLKVVKVSDIKTFESNGYFSSLFEIELKGDYASILKAINFIERSIKYIKIASIDIYSKNDPQLKTKKLYGKVYLQSISKN